MQTAASVLLPGTPADIHMVNGQLLISFPILKCIKYYNASTCALEKNLDLPDSVSSFAVSGDNIYYSSADSEVARLNVPTMTKTTVSGIFYNPSVLVNEKDRLLYVLDCGTSGSKVHYYDLNTLALRSETSGIGFWNLYPYFYFDGEFLYVMNYRIDRLNANHILNEYVCSAVPGGNGLLFVNDQYVITMSAFFEKDTTQPLLTLKQAFQSALITKSNYLLLLNSRERLLYVIPDE